MNQYDYEALRRQLYVKFLLSHEFRDDHHTPSYPDQAWIMATNYADQYRIKYNEELRTRARIAEAIDRHATPWQRLRRWWRSL